MLPNLRTLHRPTTINEAAALLARLGVKPLYGGALIRENDRDLTEAVDLSRLGLNTIAVTEQADGHWLNIGSMVTLEQVRVFALEQTAVAMCALAAVLLTEYPETLRNALTPGDVITEMRPNSLLLTFFVALGERTAIVRHGGIIIARCVRLDSPQDHAGFGFDKVSRTPADAPIVGAVAWVEANVTPRVAVCGLTQSPMVYTEGMPSQIDDYLGSAGYRTQVAAVVARRALERAAQSS